MTYILWSKWPHLIYEYFKRARNHPLSSAAPQEEVVMDKPPENPSDGTALEAADEAKMKSLFESEWDEAMGKLSLGVLQGPQLRPE